MGALAAAAAADAPPGACAPPAARLHALWVCNAAWVRYMDAFAAWKEGDASALARSLRSLAADITEAAHANAELLRGFCFGADLVFEAVPA